MGTHNQVDCTKKIHASSDVCPAKSAELGAGLAVDSGGGDVSWAAAERRVRDRVVGP